METSVPKAPDHRGAYTISEFTEAYRFSRATLYNMWRDGCGPRRLRVRGRTLISREAADEWRRSLEAA